ncbi:hypothetical protein BSLG_001353 [Batrachochytrium salamandrivorans]|nr:hypothetical protein BSLG_001353 [Batrachochytrium salamandrivorans]
MQCDHGCSGDENQPLDKYKIESEASSLPILERHPHVNSVPGLSLFLDFMTEAEESQVAAIVDTLPWSGYGIPPNPELKRRTQQYGFLFLFRTRKIVASLAPLPDFSQFLIDRMRLPKYGVFVDTPPNHVLINEYQVGQGIMPHVDSKDTFGPTVTSLSLLSPCVMTFTNKTTGVQSHVLLPRRSLLVLTGDARDKYTHAISKDDTVFAKGELVERGRRISLTIRSILDSAIPK